MEKTYPMDEIAWTKDQIVLPEDEKRYRMHHLTLTQDDSQQVDPYVRNFALRYQHGDTLICNILVGEEENGKLLSLQSALLMSKLDV